MVVLHKIDCMKFMAGQAPKSFDLVSGDPPYYRKLGQNGSYRASIGQVVKKKRKYEIPTSEHWCNEIPDENYLLQAKRVGENQIIWGANYYDFIGPVHKTPRRTELDQWIAEHPVGWIVWDKLNGDTDFNDFELAWTSYDRPTTIFKFLWNGMIQGKSLTEPHIQQGNKKLNQKRIHPTQKPIQLYRWMFSQYKVKNVLETHAGSFSAGIAAYDLGIDLQGCEIKDSYHRDAWKRFENHSIQKRIFEQ